MPWIASDGAIRRADSNLNDSAFMFDLMRTGTHRDRAAAHGGRALVRETAADNLAVERDNHIIEPWVVEEHRQEPGCHLGRRKVTGKIVPICDRLVLANAPARPRIGRGPATKLNGHSRVYHCATVGSARYVSTFAIAEAEFIICPAHRQQSLLACVDLIHGRALGAEALVPILARIHWRLGRVPACRL